MRISYVHALLAFNISVTNREHKFLQYFVLLLCLQYNIQCFRIQSWDELSANSLDNSYILEIVDFTSRRLKSFSSVFMALLVVTSSLASFAS